MEIPKIKLVPEPESEEAKDAVGYQWNQVAGTRHYLGGEPQDMDRANYPLCQDCGNQMTFYAQIDSIGDRYDLADCMVIHNFVCFDCFTVQAILSQART